MNIVDVNVLLYSVNRRSSHHQAAHDWLTRQLSGTATVGFTWTALVGFIRIATSPSILPNPLTATQAFGIIDAWLASPAAVIVEPTIRHPAILRGLLADGAVGNLTNDAHLAALAIEYGGAVATFDRDFARFGVEVVIPE